LKKLRPIEAIVVVFVCLFLLAVMPVTCRKSRTDAYRITCARNLSVIGNAMMGYAKDYDGKLPRSGADTSFYSPIILHWDGADRLKAFNLKPDGSGGQASISSCFYLLVKYYDTPPKFFVCPGDSGTTEFRLADANAGNKRSVDLWDFGPFAFEHCSYSYHMPFSLNPPFGLYPLTTACDPNMAVIADRNPWIRSPAAMLIQYPDNFTTNSIKEVIKVGNSISHQQEGQNVLFLDNHVNFEKSSFCGINDDNIYTYWYYNGNTRKFVPGVGNPGDRTDSILIHDQPSGGEPRPIRNRRGNVIE